MIEGIARDLRPVPVEPPVPRSQQRLGMSSIAANIYRQNNRQLKEEKTTSSVS